MHTTTALIFQQMYTHPLYTTTRLNKDEFTNIPGHTVNKHFLLKQDCCFINTTTNAYVATMPTVSKTKLTLLKVICKVTINHHQIMNTQPALLLTNTIMIRIIRTIMSILPFSNGLRCGNLHQFEKWHLITRADGKVNPYYLLIKHKHFSHVIGVFFQSLCMRKKDL
jgi:hypothetical protein